MKDIERIEEMMHRLIEIVAKTFNFTTQEAVRAVCMSETMKRIMNNFVAAGTPEQEGERIVAELRMA